MKFSLLFVLLFVFSGVLATSEGLLQKFDKAAFYAVMASGNLEEINNELDIISSSPANEKEGYEGALLMRKAGQVKRPAEKLKFFKAGRIKLETALLNDKDNAEFHFLRFAIQEHAPNIVKYHSDLKTDKEFIKKTYKDLPPVVQHAIMDYTRKSKLLTAQDL
jgi:hypothetical protein